MKSLLHQQAIQTTHVTMEVKLSAFSSRVTVNEMIPVSGSAEVSVEPGHFVFLLPGVIIQILDT